MQTSPEKLFVHDLYAITDNSGQLGIVGCFTISFPAIDHFVVKFSPNFEDVSMHLNKIHTTGIVMR